jgi:hypothetical protein
MEAVRQGLRCPAFLARHRIDPPAFPRRWRAPSLCRSLNPLRYKKKYIF